ncbi:oxidoreductase [Pseudomonas sp. CAN2814]|uniref:oxidoreductase n=1 Tax=Pseudomonas sp. CAN1 TaxID=3046726 RepID=UPI002647FC25|nr:oxidoreductase [Pseudomonas sp. CAN1]MDN6859948.1 oxidoreductase [Pseudomonas sp. CAN1]
MSAFRHFIGIFACLIIGTCAGTIALAAPEQPADQRTLLTVAVAGQPQLARHFTLARLQALPSRTVRAMLPEETQAHTWEGVRLSDLLVGSPRYAAQHLRVEALNDYSALIPLSDLERFQPILAYRRDDQLISIAERGPLFIIYPMVDHPELRTQVYINRTVWQVSRITVE